MTKVLDRTVRRTSLLLLRGLDTPRSLTVWLMIKHGEWDQLASLRTDPSHYLDAVSCIDRFRRDYQATELLRKYSALPVTADRAAVAREGFWSSEKICALTNARLANLIDHPVYPANDGRLPEFIRGVRKIISYILGDLPTDINPRFGPGVTFEKSSWRGKHYTLGSKMEQQPSVTRDAYSIFRLCYDGTAWDRARISCPSNRSEPLLVRGNRFTTVPKDATKDRGICVEPGGNIFCQLGVGSFIRQRLLHRAKLDLEQGQSLHRRMAMEGSISNRLSTIDLSSASDTVSLKLCELLLPREWFELLYSLRSPFTLIMGKWVRLEKFSSMGNGFTFELETLIFYAIALVASGRHVRDPEVKVYGDDIIVPATASSAVTSALRFFGFTPNPRKTFTSGPFRESCGGDFYLGEDVTPFRIKEVPDAPHKIIALANGCWRLAVSRYGRQLYSRSARLHLLDQLPSRIRSMRGPSELGDLLITDYEWRWRFRMEDSIRWFQVYRPIPFRVSLRAYGPDFQLALLLYGVGSAGLIPRGFVSGYKFGRVAFS